ncbi:hypothetical protein CHS0354_000590 [Potamilus streckersoni]|uniref:1-acylglycerol-3-phosphate O-acyltransferase n=1 Tax=Potamilus streckersoni TaxID=2493646 RepID=A0AAE0T720_9BIVA|nr:hypothetical protein CHS0354_000590 [Potamilus streckersoni]
MPSDPRKPYIVVCNHQSLVDIPIICCLSWDMKWLAKEELFKTPFLGTMMKASKDIPVQRDSKRGRLQALVQAIKTLEGRSSVMLFPEGTRSPDGKVYGFMDGIFSIAMDRKVDILPLAIDGSIRILKILTTTVAKIPLPVQMIIAVFRSVKRKKEWTRDRYSSRLNELTKIQSSKLYELLRKGGHQVDVLPAYYFTPPYLDYIFPKLRSKYQKWIVVPMLPIEAEFSCGIACKMAINEFKEDAFKSILVLKHFWNDDKLADIMVNKIVNAPIGKGACGLILSVHGTLVKDYKGNEPALNTGHKATLDFFHKLKKRIEEHEKNTFSSIKLGALNHKFGGTWMPETIERAFEELSKEGIDHVSLFPFGFFTDNSESDYEAKRMLEKSDFKSKQYISCLNDDDNFIEWLAERIRQKLQF